MSRGGTTMTRDELVDFIAGIPDLTSHTVFREGYDDHDDHYAVVIHDAREVARRVVTALAAAHIIDEAPAG